MTRLHAARIVPSLLLLTALGLQAGEGAAPAGSGLYNVSLLDLGATAKGSGLKFNPDWQPNGALTPWPARASRTRSLSPPTARASASIAGIARSALRRPNW